MDLINSKCNNSQIQNETEKKKQPEFNVKITDKKYVRYKEGAARYSMGLHTFQELAKEANALYRVRNIVLVNTQIFEEFLETFRG